MLQIHVASAIPLSDSQKEKLEKAFTKKHHGKELNFNYQVKAELIAGVSVSVAGKLHDPSLRARFNQLASRI